MYIDIFSSGKKSCLSDENNRRNTDIGIQGKKINFNEEISNLNLIQNKNNSNIYKTALKEENKCSFFLSPKKPTFTDPAPNPPLHTPPPILLQNKLNLAPNGNNIIDSSKENKNINYILKNNKKITCTCTRTQCQKKYCACFSHGIPCQGCDCKGCLNTSYEIGNNNIYQNNEIVYDIQKEEMNNNSGIRYQENNKLQSQRPVCNCTKSRCLKKYCECFKMNISCGSMCRCMDCDNKNNINNNENINNINIVNNNNFNGENENQNQTDYLINNDKIKFLNQSYDIYAFGVFIHNNKLIAQVRFVDLNNDKININTTPKLTNKKRNRNKNENSNLKTCPTTNSPFRKKRRGHTQVNSNVKNKKLVMNC